MGAESDFYAGRVSLWIGGKEPVLEGGNTCGEFELHAEGLVAGEGDGAGVVAGFDG